jgi:3-oxoacyl-[acyl-carrier-protein] synthase III
MGKSTIFRDNEKKVTTTIIEMMGNKSGFVATDEEQAAMQKQRDSMMAERRKRDTSSNVKREERVKVEPTTEVSYTKESKKIAKDDRSTFAVFSDGASAIILSDDPKINIEKKIIKTYGAGVEMLYQPFQGDIKMKGKELWDFTRTRVVPDINLLINHATNQDNFNEKINIYMHQASKVVVEGISAQLDIKKTKIFKNYENIGNTVSSSIPILIKEKNFKEINEKKSIISGFGVGIMSYNLLLTPCL